MKKDVDKLIERIKDLGIFSEVYFTDKPIISEYTAHAGNVVIIYATDIELEVGENYYGATTLNIAVQLDPKYDKRNVFLNILSKVAFNCSQFEVVGSTYQSDFAFYEITKSVLQADYHFFNIKVRHYSLINDCVLKMCENC